MVSRHGGKVPKELIAAEMRRNMGDAQTRVEILIGEGVRLLNEEKTMDAARTFAEAREVIRKCGMHQEYVAPAFSWLVTALRKEAEDAKRAITPEAFRASLKRLHPHLKEALRISRRYKNNLPHALREAGLVCALEGRIGHAKWYLDRSQALAATQGAQYELMLTLRARAEVGREVGWVGAAQDLSAADEIEAQILPHSWPHAWPHFGRMPTGDDKNTATPPPSGEALMAGLSLADRFRTLLEVGRRISSSLTPACVYDAVRDAAMKLLRGERCLVFSFDGTEMRPVASQPEGTYSKDVINQVVKTGAPIVWVDGPDKEVSDSVLLNGLRSSLCAPFFARGRLAGCFYVVHHHVSALFGEEERRLSEFVAALAGVALENAQGFAELQGLSESRNRDIVTIQLAQDELKRRATELARSNEDLQRFAYVASHDLKEPLRMVAGFLKLLAHRYKGKLGADADDFIGYAVDGATRMHDFLDSLLSYSRVGAAERKIEKVDLNVAVRGALKNLKASVDENGAVVEWGSLPTIVGNATQMMQLFQNLIGNAIKFKRNEAPRVSIRTEERPGGWHISVEDNGIGIEREYLDRIFILFQRLNSRNAYEATGLGLAICKRIVELHGGRIWVESTPGRGSTFFVFLPDRTADLQRL